MENLNTLTSAQKLELMENPNTPDTTLIELVKYHSSGSVDFCAEAILKTHKKLSERVIRAIATQPISYARGLLASHPDLPEDLIRTFAAEDSMISVRIAERENLSDDVKKILANNENGDARFALVKNHELDTETAELLAADKYASIRHIVAERCELSEKTLRKLGGDPDEDVRSAIARRKDLPRDMHETLVNDEWWMVRRNLALRSDLSEEHARKLASDSNMLVVDALAYSFCRGKEMPDDVIIDISKKAISATNFSMNPAWRSLIAVKEGRLPDEAMRILANSNERVIREENAKREDLPEDLVRTLAKDKDWEVRNAIAMRKDLPEDIIRTLAYDPNDLVRRNIAHHKNLPDEVKRLLAADRDPVVRELIAKSVNEINPQEYISGSESFLVEKSQRIEARPAIPGEEIITVLSDGTKETKNTAKEGDMVVNNVGSPEKWVIDADTFNRKYQAVPGNDGVFMPTGKPMQAYKLDKDVTLTAPWGEEQNIKAGGYLLQDPDNPSDIYGIGKDEFEKTYKAINENKKESFTETLSDEDKDIRREIVAGILAGGEDKDEDIRRAVAASKDPLIPEDAARTLASVDRMPANDEDIRRAVAASKDPLIPEDVARALASIAKEGDTYPRVKGYNPSIEPLDEIFQKKCLESNVRRVGGKIMGMDDAMSKTIKEAQSSGKFSRNELLDYIDIVNEKHNGALDKKNMYELVDKPLKPKPSDEIIVDGIPIRRKDITPCPGSDFAVGRVTDTAYCLFNAKTNTPAGDRTTLYSYIDPEEHSGYHLVKTLPDERGNVSYNYIDHNGDKLCKKNLAFAKPFDSKGFAVVKLLGGGPLLIDNKSVVRQKAEVSTGVKLANTKGIKL